MKDTLCGWLLILMVGFISCQPESETATIAKESAVVSHYQDTIIAETDEEPDVLQQIKLQIARGDYSQVEQVMSQINAYEKANVQNEELTGFPKLNKELLIKLFNSIKPDAFKQYKAFELKYSSGTTPMSDEDPCSDYIILTSNGDLEYQLTITSSEVLEEELGCAESATIYFLTIQKGSVTS